jgi:hypothetical protein
MIQSRAEKLTEIVKTLPVETALLAAAAAYSAIHWTASDADW